MITNPVLTRYAKRIVEFALNYRLPSMYERLDYVELGGLVAYAANDRESYRRAAVYVDKILKDAKPGELPVEQPTKFELAINLKTAKQIGVTIPPYMLARVDKVIKVIKYRASVLWLISLVFASIHPAEAQQLGKKVTRIGVLSPGSPPLGSLEAFRQTLREVGYIDGQNITIEWRFAEGKNDRLPELAKDLVRLKVDVIFVINTQAAQATKKVAGTIPIVFARVSDPTRTGLVASLSRPGGNITGLSNVADELGGKRLELLKETLPHVSQVAVLWNSGNPGVELIVKEMEFASPRLNVQLHSVGMREPKDFLSASETLRKRRFGALFVLDDLLVTSYSREIMDLSQENRMPVISLYEEFVDIGGLMAYGPSIPDMYRRAAMYVDKILKGVKPGELPVEQPTKFELVINLKTAKQIGITIPPHVLARADKVIR